MKDDTQYIVMNENVLGYLIEAGESKYIGVYSAPVLKGGHRDGDPHDFERPIFPHDTYREATIADFEEYRVWPPPKMQTEEWKNENRNKAIIGDLIIFAVIFFLIISMF